MEVSWNCKAFSELTAAELYAILRVRNEVFVVEQKILFNDADGRDENALHLIGYPADDKLSEGLPCAYCRIFPPGLVYSGATIGRVLVNGKFRRRGCGIALMKRAIDEVYKRFGGEQVIELGAQLYLKRFYEDLGFFHDGSPIFKDGDDIDHIHMVKFPSEVKP